MRSLFALWTVLLCGCAVSPRPALLLSGETMGSAWTVKVAGVPAARLGELDAGVQARFDAVNAALSTYLPDSDLSRFNADHGGEWRSLGPDLFAVLAYALDLAALSEGSYDVTVGPLVNLWGFGPGNRARAVPSAAEIEAARARVGWKKVELDVPARRARKPAGVYVDLSSLGKGYGVDRVADYLDAAGVSNYLIDLSGKLRARGRNERGAAWRIGVETPGADSPDGAPQVVSQPVALEDAAIATAGDYRRFFESGGQHYSHIIDPKSGAPVDHGTVSATVYAKDCLSADAWATVFMTLRWEQAMALADRERIAALLVRREGETLQLVASDAWREVERASQ